MTNHAMGADQWFWLCVYIIVPILCIYALYKMKTGRRED